MGQNGPVTAADDDRGTSPQRTPAAPQGDTPWRRTNELVVKTLRALIAALTVALVVAPLGPARSAAGCTGISSHPPFTVIDRPTFPTGGPDMTGYAIATYSPNVMFATNGQSVMVTLDGGCEWQPRFQLDLLPTLPPNRLEEPISAANSTIVDIDVPRSDYADHNVYLTIAESVGPVTRPHVLVSRDAGNSWKLVDNGLPPAIGQILGLHVAPHSPGWLYLQTMSAAGNDELYASTDGGANWAQRGGDSQTVATDMTVDPQNSNELWLWGPGGLYHSENGGNSRTLINYVAPSIGMVDVAREPGQNSRVMAFEPETQSFSVSTDSGRTWRRIGGPVAGGHGLSIASLSSYDALVSMHEGVYRMVNAPGQGLIWLYIGQGPRDIVGLTSDDINPGSYYGRSNAEIVKYTAPASVPLTPFDIQNASLSGAGVPHLVPEHTKLTLKPHQTKRVPFTLDLPPLPNPLDVFFLVDTTKSMDASINGLRVGMADIINKLAAAGLDVEFGVGEIKDYPIPGYGDVQAGDFPYRLDRKIGPPDAELQAALNRLQSSGGGALDQPESQLTGLYQAATGAGDPPWVPQGESAGFRDDALKVIVNITDAPFHDEAAHPSPPFQTVANALNEKEIEQVGLAIYGPSGSRGMADLREMAADTQTTSPEPVDCDGNGSPDLSTGDPLVCEIADQDYDGSLNLAPAIVALLEAITKEVSVEIVPTGTPDLVSNISPGQISAVNLKDENTLDFEVSFSCPQSLLDSKHDVKLEAKVAGAVEETSTATIECKPAPVKKQPKKPLPQILANAAAALPIALAAPPAPPPPPVEQIPGSQSAAQAQGAMATEQQEELQVAVVKQRKNYQPAKEEEYKFSVYRGGRDPSPAPLYAAALLMTIAVGAASATRRRFQVAWVKRRRR